MLAVTILIVVGTDGPLCLRLAQWSNKTKELAYLLKEATLID